MRRTLVVVLLGFVAAVATSCSCGSTAGRGDSDPCPGKVACGSECVESSTRNCGRCGVRCLRDEVCSAGACVPDCSRGLAFEGLPSWLVTDSNKDWLAIDLDLDGELDWAAIGPDQNVLVYFAGEDAPGFVSKNIASSLESADVDGDGHPDLVARTMDFVLFAGPGKPPHEVLLSVEVGWSSGKLFLDANGDGRLDLVTVWPSEIEYRAGDGTGGFSAPVTIPLDSAETWSNRVAAGDLDGDGFQDLVIVGFLLDSYRLLLRVARGSESGPTTPDVFDLGPLSGKTSTSPMVALADCNGDRAVEIVMADAVIAGVAGGWSVIGSGVPIKYDPIAVADLDADGIDDLVLKGQFATRVLHGIGGCRYETFVLPLSGPGLPVVADINHDGLLDIGRAGAWIRARAPADFCSRQAVSNSSHLLGAMTADFDGDRRAEIALITNQRKSYEDPPEVGVSLLAMASEGLSILQETSIFLEAEPVITSPVSRADLDGDGRPELLVMTIPNPNPTKIRSLRMRRDGIQLTGTQEIPGYPAAPFFADVNGDGRPDAITMQWPPTDFTLWISIAAQDGTFGSASELRLGAFEGVRIDAILFADRNGDGLPDLVATGWDATSARTVIVALQRQNTTYLEKVVRFGEVSYRPDDAPRVNGNLGIDIDGDGVLDVVTWTKTLANPIETWWLRGHSDGSFEAPALLSGVVSDSDPWTLNGGSFMDADGDGVVDNVSIDSDTVVVRRGLGQGTFAPPQRIAPRSQIEYLEVGPFVDFDGDGRLDYAWFDPDTDARTATFFVNRGLCGGAGR